MKKILTGVFSFITLSSIGQFSTVYSLPDITALTSFVRNGATTVIVKDKLRGANFYYHPSSESLTVDNGIVFAASDGGYWVRDVSNAVYTNVQWYGAKNTNSSSENTTIIQS